MQMSYEKLPNEPDPEVDWKTAIVAVVLLAIMFIYIAR
jgi:hypothetical protein